MRTLVLLLLLGNLGFFAWQQHWLPWLPWQPEQFNADTAANAKLSTANNDLVPLVLVSEYQPSEEAQPPLMVAEQRPAPTAEIPATPTAPPPAETPASNTVASAETEPALSSEADTASGSDRESVAERPTQVAEADSNFLDRAFDRVAERLANPQSTAQIPDSEHATISPSEEGPQPTSPEMTSPPPLVAETETNAADETLVAATETPVPRASTIPSQAQEAEDLTASSNDAAEPLVVAADTTTASAANEATAAPTLSAANTDRGTKLTPLSETTPIPLADIVQEDPPKPVDSVPPPVQKTPPVPAPKVTPPPQAAPKPQPRRTPAPPVVSPPPKQATVPQVTRTTGTVCYQIGPYSQAVSAQSAAQWFNQFNANSASWEQRVNQLLNTTRVYLPPYASQQAALAAQRTLQQRGIDEHYVMQKGQLRHAISLGVYRDPLSVERRVRELRQAGYSTVRTAPNYNNTIRYWVNIRLPARRRALVGQFTRRFNAPQVQLMTCR